MKDSSKVTTGIRRRDPRQEWIARNRLHPLHQETMNAMSGLVIGPSGLLRKNPHKVGFIGPNGIKRIDRLKGNATDNSAKQANASQELLPLHQVTAPDFFICVVPDMAGGRLTSHDKDVLGLAHSLCRQIEGNGAVVAVCFGESKEAHFDLAGVDRLIHLSGPDFDGFTPEARVAALAQIAKQLDPKHWLFPDSVQGGTDLASRLAARLGERPATQAWQVTAEQSIGRSAGGSMDVSRATPKILMLLEECAEPIDETRHEVLPLSLDEMAFAEPRLVDQGQVTVDPNSIALAEAEFILSAGNGIHDWAQFHQAASILGATEGASRVAVDDGFMPRFRQVGASGTWVTARVYLAVGISGAIQHMQGIGQCDKVIAINTDAGCDMVKRASLSVIGDSEEILAELMTIAQAYSGDSRAVSSHSFNLNSMLEENTKESSDAA